jgi:hypothetical protein
LPLGENHESFGRATGFGFPGKVIGGTRFFHHDELISHPAFAKSRTQLISD